MTVLSRTFKISYSLFKHCLRFCYRLKKAICYHDSKYRLRFSLVDS